MIRRALPVLLTLCVFAAFVSTLVFLYKKSEARPIVYKTVSPTLMDIVKKTVAPRAIVPRREVTIKPPSLESLFIRLTGRDLRE